MSPDSKKDLIVTMDQLRMRVDAGRTNEPHARRELSYIKTGAQRGTNQSHGNRLWCAIDGLCCSVAQSRRKEVPIAREHRAMASSYAAGFLCLSWHYINEAKNFFWSISSSTR